MKHIVKYCTDRASSSWIGGLGGWWGDSLGLTWIRLDSLGLTWTHLDSLGLTWTHLDSLGLTFLRQPYQVIDEAMVKCKS